MDERKTPIQEEIAAAWQDKNLPNLYFNGFLYCPGSGDASLILQRNGRPVAVANMPLDTARELGQGLLHLCAFVDQQRRAQEEALARSVLGDNGPSIDTAPTQAS